MSLQRAFAAMALMLAALAAPALAQDDPADELDALSRGSASASAGLALARTQSDSGDLLGALATLDRVLIVDAASQPALLLRGGLLCRIDDLAGGRAQLGRLKKRDFPKELWTQAQTACGLTQPPATHRNQRWRQPGF